MAHVLFVDDDVAHLVIWEATCSDTFPILTAPNADAAMTLMARHEVAVILADQRMPGTSGVELLERIAEEFPETIRILMTAYTDLPAAIDAINRGRVRRYLRKPCEPDELKAEITDAIELYDVRKKVSLLERRLMQAERVYSLGLVAASVAHELRNPVSWIRDNVTHARKQVETVASAVEGPVGPMRFARGRLEEANEALSDALTGVQRILDIVQSLELPTRDTGDDSVEITDVLRLVLRMVRGELRGKAALKLDTRPVPRVRGNSTKIGQVVLNLIVNALQAVSDKGSQDAVVTVRLDQAGDFVILDVLDNGRGIPENELQRVFDPLYTTKRGGVGLGLAISKKIVEDLGGILVAENRDDGGAAFRLRLPVYRGGN